MDTPAVSLYDPVPEPDGTDLNPRDPDALPLVERHLLSCCLWGDPGADDALELVESADFTIPEHAAVFGVVADLRRAGRPVHANDVFESLARAHRLGLLGGAAPAARWLGETAALEWAGNRARYYAAHVREASLFRRLRGVAAEIAAMSARPPGPASDVLGRAEQLLFELTDVAGERGDTLRAAPAFLRDALDRIDERIASGGALAGVATGYHDLDDILGGMRPGQLVVVGARPGGGKTALGLNVAVNAATAGEPVVFFSMEMPESEIAGRLLAMGSGVSMHSVTRGARLTADEVRRIAEAAGRGGFGGCDFYLDATPDQPAGRLAAVCRRAVRRFGAKLAVVDYLQLMRPENPRENRVQQVGMAARRVKQVARECGIPVVLLCQLNRQVEGRPDGKPRLSDLRESGEIEQHADAVILLSSRADQPAHQPVWETDVIVAKNRNGPVAETSLAYRRAVMRFENLSRG